MDFIRTTAPIVILSYLIIKETGYLPMWHCLRIRQLHQPPGVQWILDPTFNPQKDSVVVGSLRTRLIF